MRFLPLALALALPASAFAQDREGPPKPPPRMPVDETPTQYACTLERLLRGERCTFEFDPQPGEPSEPTARENSRAAAVAARYCAAAATPVTDERSDATLRKMCEDDIARIALDVCSLEGRLPLRDSHGRVASAASECVDSLGHVLARTRTMAGMALSCCRCLAAEHCAVPASQCNSEVVDLSPGEALKACLEKSCESACSVAQYQAPPKLKPYPPLPPYPPYPYPYPPYPYPPPYWPHRHPPYPPYPRLATPRHRPMRQTSSGIPRNVQETR